MVSAEIAGRLIIARYSLQRKYCVGTVIHWRVSKILFIFKTIILRINFVQPCMSELKYDFVERHGPAICSLVSSYWSGMLVDIAISAKNKILNNILRFTN